MPTTSRPKTTTGGSGSKLAVLFALLLSAVTVLVYGPCLDHGFIFDDYPYISGSPDVQKGLVFENLKWALTEAAENSWQPLTWLSLMLNYELHGLDPAGYHLTNLVLHIVSSLILFFVLRRLSNEFWPSALAAALFALHPVNVESVAWASQRKNVLSAFFWMLTMWSYVWYVQRPSLWRYLLVSLLFILGLMSKLTVLPFPLAMLLLDYWPLGRLRIGHDKIGIRYWQRVILEKVPWLFLGAAVVVVLVFFAPAEAMINVDRSMGLRMANAVVSYMTYLGQLFWPAGLAVWYPFPQTVPWWQILVSLVFLGTVTGGVLWWGAKRPCLPVGWLWYIGVLVPALGLVQSENWPARADHHLYLPAIGIFIMTAFGLLGPVFRRSSYKPIGAAVSVVLIFALAFTARHQSRYWENEQALYGHALEVTENNIIVHNNLGVILMRQKQYHEALDHFRKVIQIDPEHGAAYHNMGIVLNNLQRHQEAYEAIRKALRLNPDEANIFTSLGMALVGLGREKKALGYFEEALRLDPLNPVALLMLGDALNKLGRYKETAWYMRQAVALNPGEERAYTTLGIALAGLGRYKAALEQFTTVLHLNPKSHVAHYNIGLVMQQVQKYAQARQHYETALRFKPNFTSAQAELEKVKAVIDREKKSTAPRPTQVE